MADLGRRHIYQAMLASAAAMLPAPGFAAEKIPRVAMTAADVPLTTGQASQGGEGIRFMGITAYDALVNRDLSRSDIAATLRPGLALTWSVDPAQKTVWTFRLRPGVTFHDGSAFTADAVVWNLDKLMRRDSPRYDQAQATQAATWTRSIARYSVIDPMTVQIETPAPNANLPYDMASIFMSSPARRKKMSRNWAKVASRPSGTGPWMVTKVVPRERVEFVRNASYWDARRVPRRDRLTSILVTDPELTRRYISEIADGLVPALQTLGCVRTRYEHTMLRDNLLEF